MDSNGHHLIGRQLGSCVLEKHIGSGGMGMVFLARQVRLSREVAVKVLRSGVDAQSLQNEEFLMRFRREANVIAHLDHINILPLYEYGEQDNLAYLVMPYLSGGSLRDLLLKRGGPLAPQQALTYIEQAAAALQYAHDHKIVHRDIKPGNMLLHSDGRLVIVDFGIAHIMQESNETADASITGTGHFLGSVDYMAPEMAQGQRVDNRTDIYELGVVLFQMLTGQVPFKGTTPFIIAARQIHEPPPHAYDLNSSVPAEVDAVVQKALAKDPNARYQSAQEFALALREAIILSYPTPELAGLLPSSSSGLIAERPSSPSALEYLTQKIPTSEVATPKITPRLKNISRDNSQAGYALPPGQNETSTPSILKPAQNEARIPSTQDNERTRLEKQPTMFVNQQPAEYEQATPAQYQQAPVSMHRVQNTPPSIYIGDGLQKQEHTYPTRSRRGSSRFLTVSLILLVIVALLTSALVIADPSRVLGLIHPGSPQTSPTQSNTTTSPTTVPTTPVPETPTLTADQQAQSVVQKLYDDVNKHNYKDAYNQWSLDYQNAHPYAGFVQGYANTLSDNVVPGTVQDNPDGTIIVNITLYATDMNSTVSVFTGPYHVGRENGTFKLISANLQPAQGQTTPASTSTQDTTKASAVVQKYYDAINKHDYQTAYNLWSDDYHSTHTYNDFKQGYANTLSDDVGIGEVDPLANNTYRVLIDLVSKNSAGSSATATAAASATTATRYSGYFIVGQVQDGSWKLLDANLQSMDQAG